LEGNEHYKYSSWINGRDHYNEFKHFDYTSKDLVNTYIENMETPLEWVIRHFQEKGYGNNHCFINVGNVDSGFNYDIPYKNEGERRTSPCLRGIDFKIKDHYLIMSVIFRSWDLYNGFPENMGGLALLMDYLSKLITVKTGKEVNTGSLNFFSWGLHVYSHAFSAFAMRCGNDEILERFKHIKEGV
jgi:thymidylate synthase